MNAELIQVLKNAVQREYDRIDRAEREIIRLKLELLELGVEMAPDEFVEGENSAGGEHELSQRRERGDAQIHHRG